MRKKINFNAIARNTEDVKLEVAIYADQIAFHCETGEFIEVTMNSGMVIKGLIKDNPRINFDNTIRIIQSNDVQVIDVSAITSLVTDKKGTDALTINSKGKAIAAIVVQKNDKDPEKIAKRNQIKKILESLT